MNQPKQHPWVRNRFGIGLLSGLMLCLFSGTAMAQLSFPPPTDRAGRPDRRRGAGSRGDSCVVDTAKKLYHLVPPPAEQEQSDDNAIAQLRYAPLDIETLSEAPEIFWYSPATEPGTQVRFTLTQLNPDSPNQTLYTATFQLAGQEGLIRYRLPSEADFPPLQSNVTYRWTVQLLCGEEMSVRDRLRGQIKRVAPDEKTTTQLTVASRLNQAKLYAEKGYWFDSLSILTMLRCDPKQRDQALEAWTSQLKAADLDYFTQVPWLENCDCDCP